MRKTNGKKRINGKKNDSIIELNCIVIAVLVVAVVVIAVLCYCSSCPLIVSKAH